MRLRVYMFLLAATLLPLSVATTQAIGATDELVIYAYDSFVSYGLAGATIHKFEDQNNCKVTVVGVGDAGSVLNRAIMEKDNPKADILVGVDNNLLTKALAADVLEVYKPQNMDLIPVKFRFDPTYHVTPFDYGYVAINYDSEKVAEPPQTFAELLDIKWRGKLILEDPRTSSPGLAFLYWTIAVFGDEGYLDFWRKLKPTILTITASWDTAYGMYTKGEAPMVLSYATSPAYHVKYEETTRYRAVLLNNSGYLQIEGMGIVKGAEHKQLAQKFIEFMLTEDFQKEIPTTNWMFPVNPNVTLPEAFDYAVQPIQILTLTLDEIEKNRERWLEEWTTMITE